MIATRDRIDSKGIASICAALSMALCVLWGTPLSASHLPSKYPAIALSENASIVFKRAESDGEYLVVEYEINFPGVTKIRMYDENLNILYRGQFLDREKGDQKIYLRLERMSSGATYHFELEYKGTIRHFTYEVP